MSNFQGLSFDNGRETSVQTGLKCTRHQRVVNAGLGQDVQMNVERSNVQERGDRVDQRQLGEKLQTQLDVGERLVGQAGPEVTEEKATAKPARVDGQVFDTLKKK